MARTRLVLLLLASLILAACGLQPQSGQTAPGQEPDARNGERIYFTAVSNRGSQISYTGGPNFGGMMMGAYLTCASCHGPEGRGGLHQMHMEVMNVPDIRYSALNSMPEMQEGNASYGLSDFQKAVEDGEHPDGEQLDSDMPRWRLSDADLQDLYAFIQSLP
jgi:cytochrome c553